MDIPILFITLEGIDGCGKSMQTDLLQNWLESKGLEVIKTFEPGGSKICQDIRNVLLNSKNTNIHPMTELMLYFADRVQHIEEVITPALLRSDVVLCDRFYDSTTAYQGYARGLDIPFIKMINDKITHLIKPTITFVIDVPVTVGLERSRKRIIKNKEENQARFENEDIEFHKKVRKGYLSIGKANPERVVVINGNRTVTAVQNKIVKYMERLLEL